MAAEQWELCVRLSRLIVAALPSAPLSDVPHVGQRPVTGLQWHSVSLYAGQELTDTTGQADRV